MRLDAPPPSLPEPGALAPPASRLSVGLAVPTARITAELDKQVPRTLASANRQAVGAAGEVTYVVTRGGFAYGLVGDRLQVSTPIAVNVSVCKPLGPFCPTYGSCTPKLGTTVSVPLTVGSDYRLGASTAAYGIQEGCTIAGKDVTPKIREIADARIGAIRKQLDGAVPAIEPLAKEVLAAVSAPRSLAGGCARVVLERLEQARPKLANGVLSLRALARARIDVTDGPCGAEPAATLPPLATLEGSAPVPTESELTAAVTISWPELGRRLNEAVRATPLADGSTRFGGLEVRGVMLGGGPALLLTSRLEGAVCGEHFATASMTIEPRAGVLRVADVVPWQGQPPVAGVTEALATLTVPLPELALSLRDELGAIETGWPTAMPPDVPATLTLKLEPLEGAAVPHAPGLRVAFIRRGAVELQAR